MRTTLFQDYSFRKMCRIFPNKEQISASKRHHHIGCCPCPLCSLLRSFGKPEVRLLAGDLVQFSFALSPETVHRKSLGMTQESTLASHASYLTLTWIWDSNLKAENSPWCVGQRNREGSFAAVQCPGLIGLMSSWGGTNGSWNFFLRSTRIVNLCGYICPRNSGSFCLGHRNSFICASSVSTKALVGSYTH